MKHILFAFIACLGLLMFAHADPGAAGYFTITKHTFGKIQQGTPVTTKFVFTNKTDRPLIVENAEAGCGCTTPDYPKAPIAPGKTGVISVTYNAATMGAFTKEVNVKFANIELPATLTITGEVISKTK